MKMFLVLVSLMVIFHSGAKALPPAAKTEAALNEKMIDYFIEMANDPDLYIYRRLQEIKSKNESHGTPEGGIKLPIARDDLAVLRLHSIWDNEPHCFQNSDECVTQSYKRILLIGIPERSCVREQCDEKHLYFEMKAGVKTTCLPSAPTTCKDSQIMYFPEEAAIHVK